MQLTVLKNQKKTKGFTLVEVLVSLTLFTIVVTIAVSTLLKLIHVNSKAQNMQDAMTNLTFAIDSMSREIRTGTGYFCNDGGVNPNTGVNVTQDCLGESRKFMIVEGGSSLTGGTGNERISYRYRDGNYSIERRLGSTVGNWDLLTDDRIVVDDMHFTVTGTDTYVGNGDTKQPTVTIFISGVAGDRENLDAEFNIQTTVTQRVIDVGGQN